MSWDSYIDDLCCADLASRSQPLAKNANARGWLREATPWYHGMLGYGVIANRYGYEMPRAFSDGGYFDRKNTLGGIPPQTPVFHTAIMQLYCMMVFPTKWVTTMNG